MGSEELKISNKVHSVAILAARCIPNRARQTLPPAWVGLATLLSPANRNRRCAYHEYNEPALNKQILW
jgi:hypothetical protein